MIELMVVLVILAVLIGVAVPNYEDYVARSRRGDAMIALQQIANEQESFYFDQNTYTTGFGNLNLATSSPEGYYNLSIPTATVTLFIARAIPVVNSSQDGEGRFEIRSTGQRLWDPGQDGTYECDWDDAGRSVHSC